MATKNFVVKNGLTVGPFTIDADTGDISTSGNLTLTGSGALSVAGDVQVSAITKNNSSVTINDTGSGSNVTIVIDGTTEHTVNADGVDISGAYKIEGTTVVDQSRNATFQQVSAPKFLNGTSNIAIANNGNITVSTAGTELFDITSTAIIPKTDNSYDLGSASKTFRHVYVGPGSLYVNGKQVITDDQGTITVRTDVNQNLKFETSGSGDLQLDPTGTGVVSVRGPLQIEAGSNITSSDGNPVIFSNGLKSDSIAAKSTNTALTLSGNGTGKVEINDDAVITGNLTVNGTVVDLSVATLTVDDNIIDLAASTTGTPSVNSGIRVVRGDEPAVQFRWNETVEKWQFTNDGTTYSDLGEADEAPGNFAVTANLSAGGTLSVTGLASFSSNINMNSKNITSLASPTGPNDAVNKAYVDQVAQGIVAKPATKAATTANLSGTYANGTNGVGSTLTLAASASLTIDGVSITTLNDGILVKNQTTAAQNGRYYVSQVGNGSTAWILTRCGYCDEASEIPGSYIFVTDGTANGGTGWVAQVDNPATFVVGTHAISYVQFTGAGTYTAGTNMSLAGTQFSVVNAPTFSGIVTSAGVTTSSTILPTADNTINIGASGTKFATVYATTFSGVSTTAKYADLAENYQGDTNYQYGTVLMFGGDKEVTIATADTKAVAGVVSQNPAHLMNGGLTGNGVVPIALQGRVPCNVVGPVKKGDLLVSAGFGYAKANNNAQVGQVIGKALSDFSGAKGQIEVVVGRF
jgi:hypothetical protein